MYHIVCMYHGFFIHSSVDQHLGFFRVLDIVNREAQSLKPWTTRAWSSAEHPHTMLLGSDFVSWFSSKSVFFFSVTFTGLPEEKRESTEVASGDTEAEEDFKIYPGLSQIFFLTLFPYPGLFLSTFKYSKVSTIWKKSSLNVFTLTAIPSPNSPFLKNDFKNSSSHFPLTVSQSTMICWHPPPRCPAHTHTS